ncbi:hypothetical protein [Streptomyces tendae]|uniref:hypothetical protein n=1 Tax=Streptomyces tendae TaxID=1932 RepID=UPI003723924C
MPVPVPVAGSVAGRGSARRTGAVAPCAAFEAVPDAGVTGRTGARGPDSGWDTARCTGPGAPIVVASGEPVRRSPAEAGRSGCAAARRVAGVPLPAGEGAPPSARRTARCTGGVEAAAPLSAGAVDAGPPLPAASAGVDPDGRVVARWAGGVPGAVPLLAGAGVGGLLLLDGRAVVRWTGVAVGVVPTSGAVAAGLPLLGGSGARRTGLSAAVPLSADVIAGLPLPGCAGEPDGRVVARWTGGVPGAVPLLPGAGVGGLPLPVGRVVARWTGVVLPLGAVAAGLLSPGCGVPRPAGASVGEAPDGWAAVRWTGGVPDADPLLPGVGVGGLPSLDGRGVVVRWTGVVPGTEPLPAGAGAEGLLPPVGRAPARWTGGAPDGEPLLPGVGVGGLPSLDGRAVARWTGGVPDAEPP